MKKKYIILVLLLVVSLLISGCSTIPDDKQEPQNDSSFDSTPDQCPESETQSNSESIPTPERQKNVVIFGDSYSTFEGYIPRGYRAWYTPTGASDGTSSTDVRKVEQTWWYSLCEEMDYNLVLNDSWSGSTLGYTGYNGSDTSGSSSFIFRLEMLQRKKFFEKNDIDIIFVFGCTNDSWANAPLGEFKLSDISKQDLYTVLPSIPYFLGKLKEAAPDAKIVFIINTGLKDEITEAIRMSSDHFGTHYVSLDNISLRSGHPTIKGMTSIKEQVKAYLYENLNVDQK